MSDKASSSSSPTSSSLASSPSTKRVFEIYPSNNVWYVGGRLLSGPDRGMWLLAAATTLVLETLFIAFPAREMIDEWSMAPLVVSAVMYVYLLATFFAATLSDPGIVPRQPPLASDDPFKQPPMTRTENVGGVDIECKWCHTCNAYRPPRSSHCSTCNNCVRRFDHHCPWLGNCVGVRNYHLYLAYIWLVFLQSSLTIALSLAWFVTRFMNECRASGKDNASGEWQGSGCAFEDTRSLSLIVAALATVVWIGIVQLVWYHTVLLVRGETTNERIKKTYARQRNPHTRGPVDYTRRMWLPSHFPSLLFARERVSTADSLLVPSARGVNYADALKQMDDVLVAAREKAEQQARDEDEARGQLEIAGTPRGPPRSRRNTQTASQSAAAVVATTSPAASPPSVGVGSSSGAASATGVSTASSSNHHAAAPIQLSTTATATTSATSATNATASDANTSGKS